MFPPLLRALAAECRCSAGPVRPRGSGRIGPAGRVPGPPDLLPTSRLTQLTPRRHAGKPPETLVRKHPGSVGAFIIIIVIIVTPFSSQTCLLLEGLFPLVCALCEEKLDCHNFAFEGE